MTTWMPTPAIVVPHRDRCGAQAGPDPALERALRHGLALGLLAVLLVPALRGSGQWLGWWPLWLVGMPAVAWWALHRFHLPPVGRGVAALRRLRPRRQARRRTRRSRLG